MEVWWFTSWRKGRGHSSSRREQRVDEERFRAEKEREEDGERRKVENLREELNVQGDYDPEKDDEEELGTSSRKRWRSGSSSSSPSPSTKRGFLPKHGKLICLEFEEELDEQGYYDPKKDEEEELRRVGRKRYRSASSSSPPSSSPSPSAKRSFPPKLGRQICLEEGDDPEEIDFDNYELARGD